MKYSSISVICALSAVLISQDAQAYGDFSAVTKGVCASSNARQLLEDARDGDVDAMRQLGKHLIEGSAMKRDVKNGVLWLKKAVEEGDDRSMVLLGDLYRSGTGVKKSSKKALELYMAAEEAGNKNATKRIKKMSLKEALPWWEARAEDGDKAAVFKLMNAYTTGKDGIRVNDAKAVEYYKIAMEKWPDEVEKRVAKIPETAKKKMHTAGLFKAAQTGNIAKINELIAGGSDVNSQDEIGNTPLMYAIAHNHEDAAIRLVEAGADCHIANKNKATALCLAVEMQFTKLAKLLIEKGADVNVSFDDTSCLLKATTLNDTDLSTLLIKAGANVNAGNNVNLTPLMMAARHGNADVVKCLLAAGAKVNTVNKSNNDTALIIAARNDKANVVDLLVKAGADMKIRNHDSDADALMAATMTASLEAGKILLAAGANANAKNCIGGSCLGIAAERGYYDFALLLLMFKAEVNTATNTGYTPLMGAAENGHLELVKLLMRHGANLTPKDHKGNEAYTYAKMKGHEDIANAMLREYTFRKNNR